MIHHLAKQDVDFEGEAEEEVSELGHSERESLLK